MQCSELPASAREGPAEKGLVESAMGSSHSILGLQEDSDTHTSSSLQCYNHPEDGNCPDVNNKCINKMWSVNTGMLFSSEKEWSPALTCTMT